jgi:DNA polymerase III subunit delta'
MSKDEDDSVRAPRETQVLFGHDEAERTLLDAYRSGRIPHALLIGGRAGIGKATLAYRLARFVLAYPEPLSAAVQTAASLAIGETDHTFRQVAAGTHGGLLTLEREPNEKGVMRTVISVEQVRETVPFFGSTASSEGWRVCIVDTIDDLNANAANALLKVVEEPPPRSLFLLLSNAPGRVLPTIRSRCRLMRLSPLAPKDIVAAATAALPDGEIDAAALQAAAEMAEGSVSRALVLAGGDSVTVQKRTAELLATLPHVDPRALHALGDAVSARDKAALSAFVDGMERWVIEQFRKPDANARLPRLARLAEVWDKVARDARDTEAYNLDRKSLVFSVFGALAEATRA